ncbi:MAG: amidinotransferase [Candidatus Abyssobacteria bacterium SURF_5]|uniref:arginine deiminase n=1 Tax=Abyssobacteria bacterium (strain SURF_5) TaxID=2093360 RepID=A0A3A4NMT1_ABYX5|nr:MAG: amidinotransferase [Candidatus Abyssubacteria bacterium SURF_5]
MKFSLFMCSPEYYGIEYEINPWMSLQRQADRALARRQWEALYGLLTGEIGVKVELIEPAPGLPDMVFTANAGIALNGDFISSNFRNKERQDESRHFKDWFKKKGYRIFELPPHQFFEGEGDLLFAGDTDAYAGYLIRSDVYSHAAVAEMLDRRVVSLELVDGRFYHLDTCFCPLNEKSVVYYPTAFDTYARQVIEANFPDRIELTEEEALQFVANAIVIGDHYIQPPGGARYLRRALQERGFEVHELEMSEFMKAGGATKCLVLKLAETSEGASGSVRDWSLFREKT